MDATLETAKELHSQLIDFVLDAEGDLAVSLETFSAEELANFSQSHQGAVLQEMVLNMFLTEGRVGDKKPVEIFLESHPDLSAQQRDIVDNWQGSFAGLFVVNRISDDNFELTNWLTDKQYTVKIDEKEQQQLKRAKEGEILLARIVALNDSYWMFSSPITLMGRLGKPKLAVAIGNFKDNYKNYLYGDAPELLEEAWLSVERYHQRFVDFFGSDEITLPGYQLEKKLSELQEQVTQNTLEAAGIDSSKSLKEMAQDADISDEEMAEVAQGMGVEASSVSKVLDSDKSVKMVTPKVELLPHLKKAEQVTVLSFPRWGQIFLTNYTQFKSLLENSNADEKINADKLVREYLESAEIKACVWHRLSEQYPEQLEKLLQQVLNRPEFNLKQDYVDLLKEFNKNLKLELPEVASVPLHLHNLFQEALLEVRGKSNKKGKSKPKGGFGS